MASITPTPTTAIPLAIQFESLLRHLQKTIRVQPHGASITPTGLTSLIYSKLCLWANDIDCSTEDHEASAADVLEFIEKKDEDLADVLRAALSDLVRTVKFPTGANMPQGRAITKIGGESLEKNPQDVLDILARLRLQTESIKEVYKKSSPSSTFRSSKVILCFDGGGVRSLSSLIILQAIMQEIEELLGRDTTFGSKQQHLISEISKDSLTETITAHPRDFFDYIFGSSSGGLIAIMLGRLQMDVEQTTESFTAWAGNIFRHPRFLWRLVRLPPKYDSRTVRAAYRKVVGEFEPSVQEKDWKQNDFSALNDRCRTGALAFEVSNEGQESAPFIFRTYDHLQATDTGNIGTLETPAIGAKQTLKMKALNSGSAHAIPIWQAARATSAAPRYFEPVKIGESVFYDGSIVSNNPSRVAFQEVFKDDSEDFGDVVLVSIGSGLPNYYRRGSSLLYIFLLRYARFFITDTEYTHNVMLSLSRAMDGKMSYFRFQPEPTTHIRIDEWKIKRDTNLTLEEIKRSTAAYLGQPDVRENIRRCAKLVVEHRRKRL